MDNVERLLNMEPGECLYRPTRTRFLSVAVERVTLTNGEPGIVEHNRGRDGAWYRDPSSLASPLARRIINGWTLHADRVVADAESRQARDAMGSQERYTLDHGAH